MHKELAWAGCTTTLLSDFPYDGHEDAYTKAQLDQIRELIKPGNLPKAHSYTRSWLANLCSQQMKAKAILEEAGWKCIMKTASGHPEKPTSKCVNGGTCYIMWFEIPEEKK